MKQFRWDLGTAKKVSNSLNKIALRQYICRICLLIIRVTPMVQHFQFSVMFCTCNKCNGHHIDWRVFKQFGHLLEVLTYFPAMLFIFRWYQVSPMFCRKCTAHFQWLHYIQWQKWLLLDENTKTGCIFGGPDHFQHVFGQCQNFRT